MTFFDRKNRIAKAVLPVLLAVICVLALFPANAQAATTTPWPADPDVNAEAVLLVETNTNSVLFEKNSIEKMYPASTTKILTCLIALETCEMDEIVTFSETAVDLEAGDSNIGMEAGEQITMQDCLYGLMLASANECANAIAEHISGSIEAFAEVMNERAEELGCKNSHFMNPSGLYHSKHYVTAEDLMTIAKAAYNNSTFVDIISHKTYTMKKTNKTDHIRKLSTTVAIADPSNADYCPYVIGGKTGYLDQAGRCLVCFAKKDGMSLISVVMKTDYNEVFAESQTVLNYAFNNFSIKNIAESETRFSFANEKAQMSLDTSAQILTLNAVSFDDLTSSMTFVADMDDETFAAAKAAAERGSDTRKLFAIISYSYQGHVLGSVNVFKDSAMEISSAVFKDVVYINIWPVIIGAIVAVILGIIFSSISKRIRRRNRRFETRRVQQRRYR